MDTQVTRRLSVGVVSGEEVSVCLPPARSEQPMYELNLFSYPGNSGGPSFNRHGLVVGVNRGTRLHDGTVAGFSWSIRNREIFSFLERSGTRYKRDG